MTYIISSILLLGFTSLIVQLITIREFMGFFYGNEMSIAIVLMNWLINSSLGSYVGKFFTGIINKESILSKLFIFSSILPVIMLPLIRFSKMLLTYGIIFDVNLVIIISFLITLPFCFITSMYLILCCDILGRKKIPNVYMSDAVGDALGALIFSFFIVNFLQPFRVISILIIINSVFLMLWRKRRETFIVLIGIALSIFLLISNMDMYTLKPLFRNQNIVENINSKYGNIVVTKLGDQITVFENSIPSLFSMSTYLAEEVHAVIVQRNVSKVLLISTGPESIQETKKYGIEIDYVEIDPKLINVIKRFWNVSDVNMIAIDGRKLVKERKNYYDVIVVGLSNPNNLQVNRFYTVEFFNESKKAMRRCGVIGLSFDVGKNYISEEEALMLSSIVKSIKKVFRHYLVLPLSRLHIIASDCEIRSNISKLIKKKNVSTVYMNEYYLMGMLTKERINYFKNEIEKKDIVANTDMMPISFKLATDVWLRRLGVSAEIFVAIAVLIIISLLIIFPKRVESLCILTTGFSNIGLEIILIMLFQSIFGYVYEESTKIISFFMLGIVLGTILSRRIKKTYKILIIIELFMVILTLTLFLHVTTLYLHYISFYMFSLLFAILTSLEFIVASSIIKKSGGTVASMLYYSDFAGSSIGAILISLLLLPLIGIANSILLVAFINIFSFLATLFKFGI